MKSGSDQTPEPSSSASRGRGGGRGGSRGGRGGEEASSSKNHTWKDKNKSRIANHNRKRGHDKKMARGGAVG